MYRRTILFAALGACVLAGASVATIAAEQPKGAPRPKREIIPGSELMTPQERERYRRRMRGAKSEEERSRYRSEHVKQMQERARMRGLRLAEPMPGDRK
jgi:hypothetical protein